LNEGPGYTRELVVDEPVLAIADDLTVNDLRGSITLTRTPQGLIAQGRLTGALPSECVRCLTPVRQSVTSKFTELYHFPPETAPADGLVIPEDMNLDFSPVVREDMLLSVPMHVLCRPDCKGLCPVCGQNWNEGVCEHMNTEPPTDPRFAELRRLLDDENNQSFLLGGHP
jgi:uncharacterized protein